MRKAICLFTLLLLLVSNGGTQEIMTKVSSPFFNTEYCPATLYSTQGHIYRGLKIKLDLQSGEIRFVKENSDEIELTISFQVKKIEFGDCGGDKKNTVFRVGVPGVSRQPDKPAYYQVLDSGKTMLLKSIVINEAGDQKRADYGKNDIVYDKHETYFLYSPALGMIKTGMSKEAILKTLENKRAELDSFITANNIRFRADEELARVIAFYNSLPQ